VERPRAGPGTGEILDAHVERLDAEAGACELRRQIEDADLPFAIDIDRELRRERVGVMIEQRDRRPSGDRTRAPDRETPLRLRRWFRAGIGRRHGYREGEVPGDARPRALVAAVDDLAFEPQRRLGWWGRRVARPPAGRLRHPVIEHLRVRK